MKVCEVSWSLARWRHIFIPFHSDRSVNFMHRISGQNSSVVNRLATSEIRAKKERSGHPNEKKKHIFVIPQETALLLLAGVNFSHYNLS
jgi:hypothetical protein